VSQLEEFNMMTMKSILVDQNLHQALIQACMTEAEEKFKKNIVMDVCRIELLIESHPPEFLDELIEVSDNWDLHFKTKSSSQMEEGESSSSRDMEAEASKGRTNQEAPTTSSRN